MKKVCFALVDCNNFFVSCERVFQPSLNNVPVVVLSNNDGCIISRSKEAKDLGIPMGAPLFKWQTFLDAHGVKFLSSNYKLYGELSARLMDVLREFTPNLEVYSIDEAFLDLSHIPEEELEIFASNIRRTVMQWTGIPVSIGIGTTKTLAKVANYRAKKVANSSGVLSIIKNRDEILSLVPVEEIWGVGRALAPKLQRMGIRTAEDLSKADPERIHKAFTVVGLRTLKELRGEVCYKLGEQPALPQSLICSRSFRSPRTSLVEVSQAISSFIEKGAERLRQKGVKARYMTLHCSTSRFDTASYYTINKTITLPVPSSDTLKWVSTGIGALEEVFEDGHKFKRAGITFTGLVPENEVSPNIFGEQDSSASERLMKVLDKINSDKVELFLGSSAQAGVVGSDRWYVSPNYLTRWQELLEVKAG